MHARPPDLGLRRLLRAIRDPPPPSRIVLLQGVVVAAGSSTPPPRCPATARPLAVTLPSLSSSDPTHSTVSRAREDRPAHHHLELPDGLLRLVSLLLTSCGYA
jgi:hypothetical protein